MSQLKSGVSAAPYDLAQEFLESEAVDGFPTIWHIRGGWYVWTGTHYAPVCGKVVEQRVLGFLQHRCSGMCRLTTIRSVTDFLRIVQHKEIGTSPCWLDGSTMGCSDLFVARNGIVRLAENSILPHDPRLFSTAAVNYDYSAKARCPNWTKFLDQLWPSWQRKLLQEWFGYPQSSKLLLSKTHRQRQIRETTPACPFLRGNVFAGGLSACSTQAAILHGAGRSTLRRSGDGRSYSAELVEANNDYGAVRAFSFSESCYFHQRLFSISPISIILTKAILRVTLHNPTRINNPFVEKTNGKKR